MTHPDLLQLQTQVCEANLALPRHGLVTLTWGNVSGIHRDLGLVAIKPSGVAYDDLTPDKIVLVDLATGTHRGPLNPSSDTPTHLALYRAWPGIGGVVHTHSPCATAFAQSCTPLPCHGTTHADHFHGPVPCTRDLTESEVNADYESATGDLIIQTLAHANHPPLEMPAILVARHGPFNWGRTPAHAVEQAVALEQVCHMAQLMHATPDDFPPYLLAKHYQRKHGPHAYYGQGKKA